MSVTLTYDPTLSRVLISATALAAADQATVERSTDQIRWTTVRGGAEVEVSAGAFLQDVSDYEFTPNVVNYYRVRGVETGAIAFVAAGIADTGADGSRTPGAPAGLVAGDLVLILASTRNITVGTVDTPAGWTLEASIGGFALLSRRYDGVWSMPTVTFTNGATNSTTLAQAAAFRRAKVGKVTSATTSNTSQANINYPALSVPADNLLAIIAAWREQDWTSVATLALTGAAEIGEPDTGSGDNAGEVWDYVIQTTAANIGAGAFTVTGGVNGIGRGMVVLFEHADYLNEQTNSLTPTIDAVWLKSVVRPFLNQTVELGGDTVPFTRAARGGVFEIVGRSLPVAVSDVTGSRRYPLTVRTESAEDADDLELLLASGDVLYLQAPPDSDCPIPSGVYLRTIGDISRLKPLPGDLVEYTDLTVREVAAPGADVIGSTVTWQTVINQYATWADLIADQATWADVLNLVGDPSEVIVP